MLPKMNRYTRNYNDKAKYVSFFIGDNELLKKYLE